MQFGILASRAVVLQGLQEGACQQLLKNASIERILDSLRVPLEERWELDRRFRKLFVGIAEVGGDVEMPVHVERV